MYVDHRKYVDFDGNEREEDFMFLLMESDLIKMNMSVTGGLEKMIRQIISAQDMPKIYEIFEEIIKKSYGVKSPDGKRFVKTAELTEEYMQTQAYSDFVTELMTNPDVSGEFISKIIPQKLQVEAQKLMAENPDLKAINGGLTQA